MGCEKAECQLKVDCEDKDAYSAACLNGKCSYSPIPNMCGNGMCEKNSNENFCSCPQDCKTPKCEGKFQIKPQGSSRLEDAKVLTLYCNEAKKCIVGAKDQTPRYLKELDRETAFGKIKIKVDYTEPMDVKKKNVFSVTMQLIELANDVSKDRGLEIFQISFSSRDRFAEKPLNNFFLKEIRRPVKIDVPLSISTITGRELLSAVTMKIDYGFTRLDKISATETKQIPKTGTLEYEFPDRVAFIES